MTFPPHSGWHARQDHGEPQEPADAAGGPVPLSSCSSALRTGGRRLQASSRSAPKVKWMEDPNAPRGRPLVVNVDVIDGALPGVQITLSWCPGPYCSG
jgi:hypothetical protein